MTINVVITTYVFKQIYYYNNFQLTNINYTKILNYLDKIDNGRYYIAQHFLFDYQLPLNVAIQNKQKILNPTYGYYMKNGDSNAYFLLEFNNLKKYDWIYPKYFIYENDIKPPNYFKYSLIKVIGNAKLYKNNEYTPYVFVNHLNDKELLILNSEALPVGINKILINIDQIIIEATAKEDEKLTVLEQNAKGWKVYIDNNQQQMLNGRYLSVNAAKGRHVYIFKFSSN